MQQQISALKLSSNDNTVRLRCPFDPPVYKADAIYSRVVRLTIGTVPTNITYGTLKTALGLSPSSFMDLAVTSLRVWGPAAPDSRLVVDVNQDDNPAGTSTVRFEDFGTQGAKRPGIAAQFSKTVRELWATDTSTDSLSLCFIQTPSASPVVAHFSVRLRLNSP